MNKRKALAAAGLVLAALTTLQSSGPNPEQSQLADIYRSGPIRLAPDPEFGRTTDWNLLFYYLFCDLTVAPDGSVFIASSRQHKIFKFDPRGKLVKTFGQKGQGPGDFNSPGDLSVLDGKYLVVGEYPLGHRISLFDLEGNFVRLLTTERPPYRPVALRDGIIAYVVPSYRGEGTADVKKIDSVIIRGIDDAAEKEVARFTFNLASIRMGRGGSFSFGDETSGGTLLAATREGNLVVGNSLQGFLDIFSPDGVKLSSVDLDIEPIPVTRDLRTRYKKFQIDALRREHGTQGQYGEILKELEKASIDHLFSDHLPLFREVLTDAEGNFLVFRRTDCLGECPILIQVYSPEGKFVCETEVKEENFRLTVDPRIKNMAFGKDGLVAMVEVRDAEDFELRVIRVNYARSLGSGVARFRLYKHPPGP